MFPYWFFHEGVEHARRVFVGVGPLQIADHPYSTVVGNLKMVYFRLAYIQQTLGVDVPPLRERVADIPLLVEYFIDRFGKKAGKKFRTIDKKSLRLLQAYLLKLDSVTPNRSGTDNAQSS
jgi:transcriptional regulator of aromatic amino acid metabolism